MIASNLNCFVLVSVLVLFYSLALWSTTISFGQKYERFSSSGSSTLLSRLFSKKIVQKGLGPNRIILENNGNIEYHTYMYVGTPPQPVTVNFDFGYATSWILSVNCTDLGADGMMSYNHSKSTTYKENGKSVDFIYGGEVHMKTILSEDDVLIGGMRVRNFTFGELIKEDGEIFKGHSALLGLGLGSSNGQNGDNDDAGTKTLVDILYEQKLISKKLVSLYLNRQQLTTLGGEILFGDINEKYFFGNITYTPSLNLHGAWKINFDSISIVSYNGNLLLEKCKSGCAATFDYGGAPFILGPKEDVAELNNQIGARLDPFGGYSVPCDLYELSDIVLKLGGRNFTLKPSEYVYQLEGTCYPAFQDNERDHSETDWIISYPLSGALYTVFDYENKQVGFAESMFN